MRDYCIKWGNKNEAVEGMNKALSLRNPVALIRKNIKSLKNEKKQS